LLRFRGLHYAFGCRLRARDAAMDVRDKVVRAGETGTPRNNSTSEATKDRWEDKLPSKTIRIAALTLAGVALEALIPTGLAIASTTALSAGDALVLDRLIKGWRPAHFMNGPYMNEAR
jgi:hypothetical protein